MTYAAGVIPDSATPVVDLMNAWDALIVGAGFTLVDTPSSGSQTGKVYKSALAANGVGDWYLGMWRDSDLSTATIAFVTGLAYDIGTHQFSKACVTPVAATTLPNQTDWTHDGSYPWNSGLLDKSTTRPNQSTAFPYWVSVTPTRLVFAVKGIEAGYIGLFQDSAPNGVATPIPLVVIESWGTAPNSGLSNDGATVTEPGCTTAVAWAWGVSVVSPVFGWPTTFTGPDVYDGLWHLSPVPMFSARSDGGRKGGLRGFLKDMVVGNVTGATAGDTFTVGADTYVCIKTGSFYWVKQV